MGVVDVEPGAVGQDHVRHAEIAVGQLVGMGGRPGDLVAADVAQRGLGLVVPAGGLAGDRCAVRLDHVVGQLHRMQVVLDVAGSLDSGQGRRARRQRADAVLGLDPEHPGLGGAVTARLQRAAAESSRSALGRHGLSVIWPPCRSGPRSSPTCVCDPRLRDRRTAQPRRGDRPAGRRSHTAWPFLVGGRRRHAGRPHLAPPDRALAIGRLRLARHPGRRHGCCVLYRRRRPAVVRHRRRDRAGRAAARLAACLR